MKTIRMHADDLGVSPGVTRGIVRCIDEGPIRSVSLIANGAAFDEAIEALRARPHVEVSVHLNLMEGRPLAQGLRRVVDANGWLRGSFAKFLLSDYSADAKHEWSAQVERVQRALPGRQLRLDSHGHVHHIPSLFRVVRDLCVQLGAPMRLVHEPHFIAQDHTASGVAKHLLLNSLSAVCRRELNGVKVDDWFIGALLTGRMSAAAVSSALARVPGGSVEVLFHPGAAEPGEEQLWANYPELLAYYYSPWRRIESERLRLMDFKSVQG